MYLAQSQILEKGCGVSLQFIKRSGLDLILGRALLYVRINNAVFLPFYSIFFS